MDELLFGYDEAKITPSSEMSLEGYEDRGSKGSGNSGVLDDLYAKVLSVALGSVKILVYSLDVCEFTIDFSNRLRESISRKTGLPKVNIHIFATHTHSGPILDLLWGAKNLDSQALGRQKLVLDNYINFLEEILCTIGIKSLSNNFPAKMYSAHHHAKLGYNRRKLNDIGNSVRMLYSLWENPGIHPDGTFDNDIPVVVIEREIPKDFDTYLQPISPRRIILLNPAFHPVVLGQDSRLVSADYPGAACSLLSKYLGDDTRAMFFLGASGDTHPMLSTQMNPVAVEAVGNAVASGIVCALADKNQETSTTLFNKEIKISLNPRSVGQIGLSVIAIGSIAIVASSAEMFTEYGIHIKKASPFNTTIVATLGNGTVGYIPGQKDFSGGEYEIDIALKHGIEPGTMNNIIDKTIELLNEAYDSFRSKCFYDLL